MMQNLVKLRLIRKINRINSLDECWEGKEMNLLNIKNNERNIARLIYIFSMIFVVFLFLLDRSFFVAQIFALIFLTIIYRCFNDGPRKIFYYITLLFSIMNFTISIPLKSLIGVQNDLHLYYIYLFVYIIAWCFYAIRKRNISILFNGPVNIIGSIFIIYVLISFFIADNKSLAVKSMIIYFMMASFIIMAASENTEKAELRKTLRFLQFLSTGILVLGLAKIFTGLMIEPINSFMVSKVDFSKLPHLYRIPTVFFYNPNDYALVVALIILGFFIKLLYDKSKNERIYSAVVLVCAEINLIFTMSRTAWISVIVTLSCYTVYLAVRRNWVLFKRSAAAAAVMGVMFYSLSFMPQTAPYYGKFNATLNNAGLENNNGDSKYDENVGIGESGSTSERLTLIYDVIQGVFKEKHLLGFGAGNINEYIKSQNNTNKITDPHNLWIQILGDFGVIGFGCYVLFNIVIFINLMKNDRKRPDSWNAITNMLMLFVAASALLVFGPSSVIAFTPFWLYLGLVYSYFNGKEYLEGGKV